MKFLISILMIVATTTFAQNNNTNINSNVNTIGDNIEVVFKPYQPIANQTEIDPECFRRCALDLGEYLSLDEIDIVCHRKCPPKPVPIPPECDEKPCTKNTNTNENTNTNTINR